MANAKILIGKAKSKASQYHASIPWVRSLPGPALAIVLFLLLVQCLVWIAVGIVLHYHPFLASNAALAYTLGLRHALDADHISAIDLMTRRLVALGQRPVTVGTWFSLGHSTIVIITSIVVAASSAAIQHRFNGISTVGSIIGTSISAGFILLLGAINIWILIHLIRALNRAINLPDNHSLDSNQPSPDPTSPSPSLVARLLHRFTPRLQYPWQMYPIGVLFGLGFDTSSEIALLGLSAIQSARGTSLWLILIFPVLFTAGMCLLDTLDGAVMGALYYAGTAPGRGDRGGVGGDEVRGLYYQVVLTGCTVVVAAVIGVMQVLGLIVAVEPDLEGGFWDGIATAGEYWDVIGGGVCGFFVVVGLAAVVVYGPWRRRVERRRRLLGLVRDQEDEEDGDEGHGSVELPEGEDRVFDDSKKAKSHVTATVDAVSEPVAGSSTRQEDRLITY